MIKLKKTLKRIILSILGFFGIMTFTSCYGMPPEDDDDLSDPNKKMIEMVVMYGMPPNYEFNKDKDNDSEKIDTEDATNSENSPENQTE